MYFVASSMASDAPDPSSSELLTDFDIADIENWDDQNDNSKEVDLVKMSSGYGSPQVTIPNMAIQKEDRNEHGLNLKTSTITNIEQLRRMTNSMQHQTLHSYQANSTTQSMSPTTHISLEQSHSTPNEPGHALAMLRALAQAQEEQAKLSKEQEQAKHTGDEMLRENAAWTGNQVTRQDAECTVSTEHDKTKLASSPTDSPYAKSAPIFSVSENLNNKEVDKLTNQQSTISLNSLQSPTDQKQQTSKSGKSVFQLKGQLVKTLDKKFMLVTEVAGKKVGYLISPQSGQLQSAGIPQLIQKNEADHSPTQVTMQNAPVNTSAPMLEELNTTTNSNTSIINSTDYISSLTMGNASKVDGKMKSKSVPSMNTKSNKKLDDASGEDGGSLATVAATLKNTQLDQTLQTDKVKKKKRGKGKKKKDSNEPVKPISPYLMFFKDVQASVRQQNPMAGLGEVSKLVSQQWEKSTHEQKQVYLDRSAKAKEEYQIKLAEYRATLAAAAEDSQSSIDSNMIGMKPETIVINTSAESDSAAGTPEGAQTIEWNEEIPNNVSASISSDASPVYNYVSSATEDIHQQLNNKSSDSHANDIQCEDVNMEASNSSLESPDVSLIAQQGSPKSSNKAKDYHGKGSRGSETGIKRLKISRSSDSTDSQNDVILVKNKSNKKNKRKQRTSPVESLKSPPKLTMKINIKDSIITESPTKSPDVVEERLPEDDSHENSDENYDNIPSKESKPSTQPKALLNFKIPLKKSSTAESKEGIDDRSKSITKSQAHGPRLCANTDCDKPAKTSRERGPLYCSNQCLVNHCRNVFDAWVIERKSEAAES